MDREGAASRACMLAAGVLLVGAGMLAAAEGWRLAPMQAYVHAKWWGRTPPALPEALEEWRPATRDGRAWSAFSQAALDRSSAAVEAPAALNAARTAANAAVRGVAAAPAQPAAWARLALLRLNAGDPAGAQLALALSYRTGPAVRGQAWLRSRLGLYLWEGLDDATRQHLMGDLRRLWQQPPTPALPYPQFELIRFAHGIGRVDTVREALPKGERALFEQRLTSVLKEASGAS